MKKRVLIVISLLFCAVMRITNGRRKARRFIFTTPVNNRVGFPFTQKRNKDSHQSDWLNEIK